MKLTAIIYSDSETNLLAAECVEMGTTSQRQTDGEALANLQEATHLYLESFPETRRRQAAIHTFELADKGLRYLHCPRSRPLIFPSCQKKVLPVLKRVGCQGLYWDYCAFPFHGGGEGEH